MNAMSTDAIVTDPFLAVAIFILIAICIAMMSYGANRLNRISDILKDIRMMQRRRELRDLAREDRAKEEAAKEAHPEYDIIQHLKNEAIEKDKKDGTNS